ncbi:phosphoribosylformylglycinamidine cyclo-ligase [Thermobifida fusca]|uniref:Phosphoribosylformylglycinamidine cyclo-ligase n=2 Tax=Thermobifida fusca TaxID=2021 RepID=A0A9P2T7F3_THEFU|nr:MULTISPECIES: phosphoribosylformylglycinamidine cyclo-ligase [Thermobifida]AAZ56781.1 phosphoribosylformylglycinamidine cyclo-ligase [Thermobifida fusca YX]EOR70211.1 phosphoribosylaminoimidazole synthetase [Thermobifida fusca TM51]MBO2528905.1 phosphoribosylformylglycinamidine cyclo-ligase [Thermobifida sp.]PPS95245.1 phosphoribosylaminoimidazole synthetase [Thermobifida fusca]PZN66894.1 MAG: phosphoribosylformylglycinamidine cyclo-ligase [Thermobifida fusca]
MSERAPTAYAAAGVDIAAGERAVELMKRHVARTHRPELVPDASGFAGLFRLDLSKYTAPVLATSTDGVGTKVMLAQALDRHDTIGIDLVAMVVDDLVVSGAEPLFLTDYIACGSVVPERIAEIVSGIAEGCCQAGCTLIGGETAEHPGAMGPDEYDLAGAGTGIVEADAILGPDRVRVGDVVIAMASSGPHSNGYSLIRRIVADAQLDLHANVPELGGPLGEVLLTPTRIYAKDCLALAADMEVHAFAHITGGGLAANLARSLPATADAVVDRASWAPPAVFGFLARHGQVSQEDMEATFNMGVGMVAIVAEDAAERALELLAERGVPAWVLGSVIPGSGKVVMTGEYRS